MDDKLLLDFMKEVNDEFKETRKLMGDQHTELRNEIAANREEFVIFKTRVNMRTAMISSSVAFIAVLLSIILNIGNIKDRHQARKNPEPVATEQIDE